VTTRATRLRHLVIWVACVVILAVCFAWLGLTLAQDAELPLPFWAAGLAIVVAALGWGLTLDRSSPSRIPRLGGSEWEELQRSLKQPESAAQLLDGLILAAHPLSAEPVRLREIIQASIIRRAPEALVHEGGDPYVIADPAAIAYVLDTLLSGRTTSRIELKTEGRIAEVTVRGTGPLTGISIIRRLVEAQEGELVVDSDAVRLRLPIRT